VICLHTTATDEYKAAVVYIPIANMPVDLANMLLQGLLKDGKAVIPIYAVTMQHIFIGSDRLDGAGFPDCSKFITELLA
jgi:7-cyano-7-deazaguanine synthase in queuosine biosynthesis